MSDAAGNQGARGLLVLRAGGRDFAVYADEADAVTGWREPSPLPHAPPAVLGVVCVRGRMRTLLDPARLPGAPPADGAETDAPRFIVALRGDEQLALAASHAERLAAEADEQPAPADPPLTFLRGTLRRQNRTVHLLDPARLFDAAMQGAERRRQRQK